MRAVGHRDARSTALVPEETSLTIHYDAPVGRIADLYAQVQRKGESAVPQLLKALKNSDRAYRNAALRFIQPYLGEPVYNALVKELKKAKPEVKSDHYHLSGASKCASRPAGYSPLHRRC